MPGNKAGQKTRAQILAACSELFYEKGYDNTTFADITAATGILNGSIAYHFRTKEQILIEVNWRQTKLWESYAKKIAAAGALTAPYYQTILQLYIIYYAAYQDPKVCDYLTKLTMASESIMTNYYIYIRGFSPLIEIQGAMEDHLLDLVTCQGADEAFSRYVFQSAERFQRKYDYCTAAEYNIRIPARFFPHDEALMEQSFAKIRAVLADWDWSKLDLRTLMVLQPEG